MQLSIVHIAILGGWAADQGDNDPWIEADLLENHYIYSVTVQGSVHSGRPKKFQIGTRRHANSQNDMTGVYNGVSSDDQKRTISLPDRTLARFVRIAIIIDGYGHPALRWDVTGIKESKSTPCWHAGIHIPTHVYCLLLCGNTPFA